MVSIKEYVVLAPYTYFNIGGPARYFAETQQEKELAELLRWAHEKNMPVFFLGAGSNVLVSDKGVNGLVLRFLQSDIAVENDTMFVSAGASMARAAHAALEHSLSGMEWAAGIPGTVGGSVYGNAGCFGGEMKDVITHVRVLRIKNQVAFSEPRHRRESRITENEIQELPCGECKFGYRESIFKYHKDLIILGATVRLTHVSDAEKKEKQAWIQQMMRERVQEQAIGEHTVGSTFKGIPATEGIIATLKAHNSCFEKGANTCWIFENRRGFFSAGFFIEQAGLKGKRIGGVSVSQQHANFLINSGNATAEDVIMLIGIIKEYVHRMFGIFLEEEIQYIGF